MEYFRESIKAFAEPSAHPLSVKSMLMDNIEAVEARIQSGEDPVGLHLNARELRMLELP
jgi:hypothetical protein